MTFCVSVPVLSEQIHVVDPSVSTPSRFLTRTCLACIRWAVSVRHTVTVARRPSGTLATMMPICGVPSMVNVSKVSTGVSQINPIGMRFGFTMNTRFSMCGVPMRRLRKKKSTPRNMAMAEMTRMKWWISLLMGVGSFFVLMASAAIRPMTVSSPVAITTPRQRPSGICVPACRRECGST